MYKGRKVAVVMPAYNAERTLRSTFDDVLAQGVADLVVIVDDCSCDGTERVARSLADSCGPVAVECLRHQTNRGYGGNQKTCYRAALEKGADIVVMVHPDCQYTPKLLIPMVSMIPAIPEIVSVRLNAFSSSRIAAV